MRLFVGLALPSAILESLERLCSGIPGARWVAPRNMHITLRFIGNASGGQAEDINTALAAIEAPAFDLNLDGIGSFGTGRRVRSVWAGVAACEPLSHVQGKVESAVVRAGFEPEGRKFKPHVTLGRLKNGDPRRVGTYMEMNNAFLAGPFAVDRLVLFESHLGREGAEYEVISEYMLYSGA